MVRSSFPNLAFMWLILLFQVLANADIHLDNSAELLSSIDMTGVSSPYFIMRWYLPL